MLNKKCFLAAMLFLSIFIEVSSAQASESSVVYACTRRANGGVTQTYIAPIKNGVPVCNNKNHKGPFVLFDTSNVVGTAGAAGPDGKDGAPGPSGSTVNGILRSCHISGSEFGDFFREAHCVLDGTSFTFRHIFGETPIAAGSLKSSNQTSDVVEMPIVVNDDKTFSLKYVPAGTYTLKCDIAFFGTFLRASTTVTTTDSGTVDVGTINLCDADQDGFTSEAGDCNDTSYEVYPGAGDFSCNGIDNDCDGLIDEDASCEM